jgi:hypothetical protein
MKNLRTSVTKDVLRKISEMYDTVDGRNSEGLPRDELLILGILFLPVTLIREYVRAAINISKTHTVSGGPDPYSKWIRSQTETRITLLITDISRVLSQLNTKFRKRVKMNPDRVLQIIHESNPRFQSTIQDINKVLNNK